MAATPYRMGYFRLARTALGELSSSPSHCTRAPAVATPSAICREVLRMSSSFSPRPRRTPTVLFLLKGPKHVRNVSPTPLSPASVTGEAPCAIAIRLISLHPLVTNAAIEFVPSPSPSLIPAAIAITFLIAPATSNPTVSFEVNTLKDGDESMSPRLFAKM